MIRSVKRRLSASVIAFSVQIVVFVMVLGCQPVIQWLCVYTLSYFLFSAILNEELPEVNANFLLIEWKGQDVSLPKRSDIFARRVKIVGFTVDLRL